MRSIILVCILLVLLLGSLIVYVRNGAPSGHEQASTTGNSVLIAKPNAVSGMAGSMDSSEMIQAFRNKTILNPVKQEGDPYLAGNARVTEPPGDHTIKTAVCGIRYVDAGKKQYRIMTFRDENEAARSGYAVTHRGHCGTCSTLKDLAVYLQRRDLTYAVRACSFKITTGSILSCLEGIGFTRPCALTWYYNIRNTRRYCLGTCLLSWMRREPLNRADGSLNECLQCDEDMSGPIFQYYAGRTRRNSGIRSEIKRGREERYPLVHDYY
jgi:hypothetical protein